MYYSSFSSMHKYNIYCTFYANILIELIRIYQYYCCDRTIHICRLFSSKVNKALCNQIIQICYKIYSNFITSKCYAAPFSALLLELYKVYFSSRHSSPGRKVTVVVIVITIVALSLSHNG